MTVEWLILGCVWTLSLLLLAFAVPRAKRGVAQVAFLFKQMLTWIFGLIFVESRLLEYPVRCFATVNRSSFTFEFLAFPALCAVYNCHYPERRGILARLLYTAAYSSVMTAVEWLIERYTKLIDYTGWTWYWTWVSLFVTFIASRLFCVWFFREKTLQIR